jgi:nicotinamide-nucleotide amidase
MAQEQDDRVEAVAQLLGGKGRSLAVAESLTGGELSARFAVGSGASDWLRGGLVAYSSDVKHAVLGVPPGPVVSEAAAEAMAEGVARLLDADVGVAVTGAGGPDPQDGQPPGTVWFAIHADGSTRTRLERFEGDPAEVVDATAALAIEWLLSTLSEESESSGAAAR